MSDRLKWLAVWGADSGYALDVYPEEIKRHAADVRKTYGRDNVAGPFDTKAEAQAVVRAALLRLAPSGGIAASS